MSGIDVGTGLEILNRHMKTDYPSSFGTKKTSMLNSTLYQGNLPLD